MRVLIISQYYWPETFRVNDVAAALAKEKGHQVTVFTGKPNYPGGRFFPGYGFFGRTKESFEGVEIIRAPLLPRGRGGGLSLLLNYLSFAIFGSLLAPFLCKRKYDLILVYQLSPITSALPALLLRWLHDIPIALWVQDLWPDSLSATGAVRSKQVLALVERLVRFIYRRLDLILIQSRAFAPQIERLGGRPEDIRYLPNSAEDIFQPMIVPEDASERSLMPEGFRVVFAGNVGEAQDFSTILGAAEQLREIKEIQWVILGEGRALPWAKEQIVQRGLSNNVRLLGRHPLEAMPRFFALADAMLVTLKKEPIFALTIPSKIQSYLACGKPIIAALDGEGAKVIQEASAGFVVPTESPQLLAEAVLKMYRISAEERAQLGANGLQYFKQNFERNILLDRLDKLLNDLKEKLCL
jgi:glycosyltransferase involved in cell wall biosynthesis